MKTKKFLAIAALAAGFVSCSSEDEFVSSTEKGELAGVLLCHYSSREYISTNRSTRYVDMFHECRGENKISLGYNQ